MDNLKFRTLRQANDIRMPLFKNRKGEPSHSKADGSDWSLNDWATAATGELGELCSVLKQVRRGDITLDEARSDIAKEAADVVTYLDILLKQCDLELGSAVADKFNEVSRRIGVEVYIDASDNSVHNGVGDLCP